MSNSEGRESAGISLDEKRGAALHLNGTFPGRRERINIAQFRFRLCLGAGKNHPMEKDMPADLQKTCAVSGTVSKVKLCSSALKTI